MKHKLALTQHIINIAKENKTIKAISGTNYDIGKICSILLCAINNSVFDTDISYFENLLGNETYKKTKISTNQKYSKHIKKDIDNLTELTNDIFYKEYKKYPDCVLDYCIIKNYSPYTHLNSHKKAVIFAMEKWKKKYKSEFDIFYNPKKMNASKIDSKYFFEESLTNNSYYYLFSNPPHGSNYNTKDFNKINNILFPNGRENLEIYEWSTDWSNYFDDGLEWWGTKCVSIYDNELNRFVVIGASATD